jgi:crossover junction endodeoxyribonuclease RuvC
MLAQRRKLKISRSELLVLGIDPGLKTIGYGAVIRRGSKIACAGYGVLRSDNRKTAFYPDIYRSVSGLLRKYQPDTIAVEMLYAQKNLKRALALAETRGVIMLACQKAAIDIKNIPAATIKRIVGGYGRASKAGVAKMVRLILDMPQTPSPDDAADALALAIAAAFGYAGGE